jgi:hypothetical protein
MPTRCIYVFSRTSSVSYSLIGVLDLGRPVGCFPLRFKKFKNKATYSYFLEHFFTWFMMFKHASFTYEITFVLKNCLPGYKII